MLISHIKTTKTTTKQQQNSRVDLGASYLHGYDFEDDLERLGHKMNPLQVCISNDEFCIK